MKVRGVLKSKNSIIFSWLLSYILILLIPIAFTGIVYFITVRTIEQETNRANLALLKQVQLTMDNILKDAERLTFNIAFNPSIQALTTSQEPNWNGRQYEVSEIVKEFRRMNISNGYINDFYVYFRNMDSVVSSTTASRSSLMYSILYNDIMHYEQWVEMLKDKHTGSYISISDKINSNRDSRSIAYIRSIPISNPEQALATIVIMFNEQRFIEMIQNIQLEQGGNIFILDKENKTLAATAAFNLSDILQTDELTDNNKMMMKRTEKSSFIISHTKSDVSELKYVSIVPREIVMQKSYFTQKLMTASIILCLILGGAVSIFLTLRNYNPVRELMNILLNGNKNSYDKSTNEYKVIYEAIQNELKEKEKINQKLEQQNSVVKADFLQKLLKGKFSSKISVHDAFYALDMQFISSDFIVILISIEDKGKLVPLVSEEDFEEEAKVIYFVITNILDELLKQNYKGFVTEIDESLACLINLKDLEAVDQVQEMTKITKEMQSFLRKYYDMKLTISISNHHKSINGIPEAYGEASEAMEYKMIEGIGKIICYQSVKNNVRNYFYSLEKEQKLVNCIRSGEFEKGKELLDEIINSNFTNGTPSAAMTKCFMIDLASTIVKTVKEISDTEPVEKLLECETVADLQKEITNTLLSVATLIQSKANNKSYDLSRNIMDFVDKHYEEITLNVALIAEKLKITPTYMSKLFKEQTGEALPDYINKLRLKKAKELLKNENLSISEAAVKVGYLNSNALIRSFKKYEGVTPGQYKEIENSNI